MTPFDLDRNDADPIEIAQGRLGITPTLAAEIMIENDELWRHTPEQRYDMVMAWIEGKLM